MHRVLVTGAGSGLGRGVAMALAERGHAVLAATFTDEEADELTAASPGVVTFRLDITNAHDRERLTDLDVDVLVNNAGLGRSGPLRLVPDAVIREVFETNVFGTLAVTQAVLPGMLARGTGRVLIVSSIAGVVAGPFTGPYSMTKHALQAMGSCLRAELAPAGVDVALVNPGPFSTGFNDRLLDSSAAWLDPATARPEEREFLRLAEQRILGSELDPAEAVAAIVGLVEAEQTEPVNFVPADILERLGLAH